MRLSSLALAAALLSSACATLPPEQYESAWAAEKRGFHMAYKVDVAAVPFCQGHLQPVIGTYLLPRGSNLEGYNAYIQAKLGSSDRLTISYVVPGSPADQAGVRAGDKFVSINGVPFFKATDIPTGVPVQFGIERGGQVKTVTIPTIASCLFPPVYYPMVNGVEAAAGSNAIKLTQGMMEFAKSDDDLFFVIAHETCHNIMHQAEMKAHIDTEKMEFEADRCAIKIMAYAHVDTVGAPAFIERIGSQVDMLDRLLDTAHPPTAERIAAIKAAIAEVQAAQR